MRRNRAGNEQDGPPWNRPAQGQRAERWDVAARRLVACSAFAFCVVARASAADREIAPVIPDLSVSRIAAQFARRFPREHLAHTPVDDTLSSRAWTNYLTALDYERVYFLEDDIREFRAFEFRLDDDLREGNLDFACSVFNLFRERVRDRCDYVRRLATNGFDVTVKETFEWKRKNAPWAASQAEWDELWRRKIKNEYLQRRIAMELVATNPVAAFTNGPAPRPVPSAEEAIVDRYKQYLTVLEDSGMEWVLQRFLTAFAMAYDPHSTYMSPSNLEDFDIEMKLSLVGIGALLTSEDGIVKVARIIPGGPADRDPREAIKLRAGDKIVAVAQDNAPAEDILHWPLNKVVQKIRGEKGTRVVLTVIPASDPTGSTTKTVDLVRDEVKLEEQAAKSRIETVTDGPNTQRVAVVTLPAFYADMKANSMNSTNYRSSAEDLRSLLVEIGRHRDVRGVLLDLRNNGGGSLLEAVKMTGFFIPKGPVVQVKESGGNVRVFSDSDPSVVYDGPLVVLVNRLSASASEILAAALQDYGRAVIVGDSKTHGKGTVQSIHDVARDPSMGAIKVTSSMFYRVTGNSTQLKGVIPDVVIPSRLDCLELGEEHLPNPLAWTLERGTSFEPCAAPGEIVAELRARSEARRRMDPRFQTYERYLQRIREINATSTVPLDIESRRSLARAEKDLSRAETGDDGEQRDEAASADQSDAPDLVLEESLRILLDLAGLWENARRPMREWSLTERLVIPGMPGKGVP